MSPNNKDYNSHFKMWKNAEWNKLSELDLEAFAGVNDLEKITALKASAFFNLGDIENAKINLDLARYHGCPLDFILVLFFAGVHFSLGKIFGLRKDESKSRSNFHSGLRMVDDEEPNGVLEHQLIVKEYAKLGLLPQAADMLNDTVKQLASSNKPIDENIDFMATITMLKSEIEIINHELSLAYQKGQLFVQNSRNVNKSRENRLEELSPSQLGQDLWVLKKLDYKEHGFFVEFGATDGVLLSNTFLLEKEFNWTGLCAEPNPEFFDDLKNNRMCIVDDACISGESGKHVEFVTAREFGTIRDYVDSDMHADRRKAYETVGGTINLTTISLDDFLLKHNAPRDIDYISIDTEGSEFNILSTFPFDDWNVKAFTIEHNFTEDRMKIRKLLEENGYTCLEAEWDDWYYKEYDTNAGL